MATSDGDLRVGSPAIGALSAFAVARLPRIAFGAGRRRELPGIVAGYGRRALLVTGARSFRASPAWAELTTGLDAAGVAWDDLAVAGEPSPELVDAAVARRRADPPDVVVGIGGGSVLDAAKGIAGLLRSGTSALDHLEGVGRGVPYPGPTTPFLAVPTTAGTGSEATKNAVLSGHLPGGAPGGAPGRSTGDAPDGSTAAVASSGSAEGQPYKKSFRDDRLVAAVAIVDPDLLDGCPPALIAGDGMDALTQCLEAFVSTGASPFTDAVARSGIAAIGPALPAWHSGALAGVPSPATAGGTSSNGLGRPRLGDCAGQRGARRRARDRGRPGGPPRRPPRHRLRDPAGSHDAANLDALRTRDPAWGRPGALRGGRPPPRR